MIQEDIRSVEIWETHYKTLPPPNKTTAKTDFFFSYLILEVNNSFRQANE